MPRGFKKGHTPVRKGKGVQYMWLRSHVGHANQAECLMWPFSRVRGYGNLGLNGEICYAHRVMCELAHGKPPAPHYQAAHSCGRGDQGCVNPHHVSWKTPSQNQRDKRIHGTSYRSGRRRKLTPVAVAEIRANNGRRTHDDLAIKFGVSRRTIGAVLEGRSWRS